MNIKYFLLFILLCIVYAILLFLPFQNFGKGGLIDAIIPECIKSIGKPASDGMSKSTKAHIDTTRSKIGIIESAVRTHEVRTGEFPVSINQLTQNIGGQPALLKNSDLKDSWGVKFSYRRAIRGFEIRSAGHDKKMNTPDDLTMTIVPIDRVRALGGSAVD